MTDPARADEDENTLTLEYDLDAPPEKVWRALTVPDLVTEWLGTDEAGSPDDTIGYELVEAEPFSRVRYAWHDGQGGPPGEVIFEIWPDGEGQTRFRLTHFATTPKPVSAANGNAPPLACAA
jgi:uncharacterized protein YndB with AHSA1/START domain